jgi:hypothetical protein
MENFHLTIQGQVNPGIISSIKKYKFDPILKRNEGWFFIDYSLCEIPVGQEYGIGIEQNGIKFGITEDIYSIKILVCLNQISYILSEVPRSWQTICKIRFSPEIPIWIQRMRYLEEWNYNPDQVILLLKDKK